MAFNLLAVTQPSLSKIILEMLIIDLKSVQK